MRRCAGDEAKNLGGWSVHAVSLLTQIVKRQRQDAVQRILRLMTTWQCLSRI